MPVNIFNRRGFLTICVSYFSAPAEVPDCDVHRVRGLLSPVEGEEWLRVEDHTLCLDLRQDLETIMKGLNDNTRYEVRRATNRDGFEVSGSTQPTEEELQRFETAQRGFLTAKSMPEPDFGMMQKLKQQGAMGVSFVRHPQLGDVAFHAYIVTADRVRLLWSGHIPLPDKSEHGALVGRGNRLLHWADFECFKKLGIGCYDFGGVYLGKDDQRLAGIARFKLGFGGQVVKQYSVLRGVTLPGRLAVMAKNWSE